MPQHEDNPLAALQKDGYYILDAGRALASLTNDAAAAWKKFCALPTGIKQRFDYLDGAGYELKIEKVAGRDLKENFHFKLSQQDRLLKIVPSLSQEHRPTILTLVRCCESLLRSPVYSLFVLATGTMEAESAMTNPVVGAEELQDALDAGYSDCVLRLLHYFGQEEGDVLAAPHTDKGGLTVHLYESHSGLQGLGWNRAWHDIDLAPHRVAVFAGMQFQLRTQGKIKALCHRVMSTPESRSGRYSMVCFAELGGMPVYDKDRVGRSQDQEAGFNYSIEPEEFEKLFVPARA